MTKWKIYINLECNVETETKKAPTKEEIKNVERDIQFAINNTPYRTFIGNSQVKVISCESIVNLS